MPKYNPERNRTFSTGDWQYVCKRLSNAMPEARLPRLNAWINEQKDNPAPRKADQDKLDACTCLLVALHFVEQQCLMVGNADSGYIVVPQNNKLREELAARCQATGRDDLMNWLKTISGK
jgi:predicted RNase H-like nuclease